MDLEERLRILGKSARFDLCGDCDVKGNSRKRTAGDRWEYPELVPDGTNSVMLRVLMSNRCENNCFYCENAARNDFQEASLTPDELAAHFADLFRSGRARSLFLSSAVRGSTEASMTRMAETLELIRFHYCIPSYVHAKILPGASDNVIERVVNLATRVSVNLEVPSAKRMDVIGAPKDYDGDLYGRVRFISALLRERERAAAEACRGRATAAVRSKAPRRRRPKSQTTQFVVGAAGETDREILDMSSHLYGDLDLARIYFSAFQPPGRVDFGSPRAPLLREHRLYQTDFLLRRYSFRADEIPLADDGNLALAEDPKTAWARLHPAFFPVEVNSAPRTALLRVPGLGPISVRRIVKARREGKLASRAHLTELGVRPLPALRYLLLDGARGVAEGKQVQAGFEFSSA